MSCLWQRSKILGFYHKKDIMMGLRYLQITIRYRCSSPYVCFAVTLTIVQFIFYFGPLRSAIIF